MSRFRPHGRYVSAQDFRDLRYFSDLTRKQAADLLAVSVRTIQNWETGGARIPWMAFRMLRILRGYALPGKAWEGWTVHGDRLYAPNGRWYEANTLEQVEQVIGMPGCEQGLPEIKPVLREYLLTAHAVYSQNRPALLTGADPKSLRSRPQLYGNRQRPALRDA